MTFMALTLIDQIVTEPRPPTTQSHGDQNNPNCTTQQLRENSSHPILPHHEENFQIGSEGKKSGSRQYHGHFSLFEATCPTSRIRGQPIGLGRQSPNSSLNSRPDC